MTRPLPKSLRDAIATKFADRVHAGWTEQDGFEGPGRWAHWIFLKAGWRNFMLDPGAPLHAIHEGSAREAMRQLKGATPCDCEECKRQLAHN